MDTWVTFHNSTMCNTDISCCTNIFKLWHWNIFDYRYILNWHEQFTMDILYIDITISSHEDIWYCDMCDIVMHHVTLWFTMWHHNSSCDIVIHVTHHEACDTPSNGNIACHMIQLLFHKLIHMIQREMCQFDTWGHHCDIWHFWSAVTTFARASDKKNNAETILLCDSYIDTYDLTFCAKLHT